MRSRWHKWWLLALLVPGCLLNPQPTLPEQALMPGTSEGGAAPTGAAGGSAGGDLNSVPGAGSSGVAGGAGGAATTPSTDEAGAAGAAGSSPDAETAGAAGDQLAPGPTR